MGDRRLQGRRARAAGLVSESWFQNLSADGNAMIQVREEEIPVRATVAEGEERERLWKAMVEVWPDYDSYQQRTDREIPVVILTRRPS